MTRAEKMMRRTALTALEAIGIAGLSPLTPLQIYRRKLRAPRPARRHGLGGVLSGYERRVGLRPAKQPMFRNPVQRFAISEAGWATPGSEIDAARWVMPYRLRCSPWSSLPPAFEAMAQWEMGARGLDRADVAVLFRRTLKIFCVHFDSSTFSNLYAFAEHFMAESVLQNQPPENHQESAS